MVLSLLRLRRSPESQPAPYAVRILFTLALLGASSAPIKDGSWLWKEFLAVVRRAHCLRLTPYRPAYPQPPPGTLYRTESLLKFGDSGRVRWRIGKEFQCPCAGLIADGAGAQRPAGRRITAGEARGQHSELEAASGVRREAHRWLCEYR